MPLRRAGGFTLLEVLVVVVVIGIASGIVIANIGGDERRMTEREANRLAGALEHAAALAQWKSETLGVSAEGAAYRFWRRGADGRWITVDDDDVLALRVLPASFTVRLATFAGAPVAEDAIVPFRASGRNEPYSLVLSSSAWSQLVAGDPLNRVHIAVHAASR